MPRRPDQVAVLRGPQVMFAISDQQPQIRVNDLGSLQLRPFSEIGDEVYQTYLKS